jgi:hypothetical protein
MGFITAVRSHQALARRLLPPVRSAPMMPQRVHTIGKKTGGRAATPNCGIIGADARPHWQEQPPRETLTGVQWR